MSRLFYTLDVFAARPYEGNPLAVVLDAEGLVESQMQRIAAQFNLPETVFVFPPDDPVNSAKMRIFTPTTELPFAGHPTVGTAILLAQLRAGGHLNHGITIALEQQIGPVMVEVRKRLSGEIRAIFNVPRLPEQLPLTFDVTDTAYALGLTPEDLSFGAHRVSAWSAGVPFVMVPVRTLAAIERAYIADYAVWEHVFGITGKGAAYIYTNEVVEENNHYHARMFSPALGITEDPATGSAAAAFTGVIATADLPTDGSHHYEIEQGFEMGRPSRIGLDLTINNGRLASATISGSAIRMSEGKLLTLP